MGRNRWLAAFLLVALAIAPLTACTRAVTTGSAAGLDDSIESLATGGVAVMDDVTSQTPIVPISGTPSAMRFTRWQVRNLVAEANAKNGYLGSELDALVAPPPGVPPLSTFVGAWLTRHDGPLAEYARRFMGEPDYKQAQTIVFPSIVVLAFIADIARASPSAQATPTAFDLGPWIAAPAEADGICTDVSNWVSNVVNNVTSAVQANGSGWLASIWNTVVTIAGTAFSVVVNGVLQSTVGFVTEIATIVATLTQVASMFKPWTVALAADPGQLVLGAAPVNGAFDAALSAQDIPWPQTLIDCVSALSHVNLKDASYKDARITWSQPVGIPQLASNDSKDATLRDDKTAHYTYSTITQTPPEECPTLVTAGSVGITVTVERTDVSKAIDSLVQLITNKLPPKLQEFLTPYERPAIDKAKAAVGNFKGPHASAMAMVKEYVSDPLCLHTPPPGSTSTDGPQSQSHLPFLPCDEVITGGDVAASYPSDVLITNLKPGMRENVRNMVLWVEQQAETIPNYEGAAASKGVDPQSVMQNPQVANSTACPIGAPYTPPNDPTDPGAVGILKIDALFVTLPPDGTPVDTAKSNPDCLAALGPDLDRFKAECWLIRVRDHADGPVNSSILFVFTKEARYVIEAIGSGDPGTALMRSVMQRYESGFAPPPPPPPTPHK